MNEATEALTRAAEAEHRVVQAEARVAATCQEQARVQGLHDAILRERDELLKTVREADAKTLAQAREVERQHQEQARADAERKKDEAKREEVKRAANARRDDPLLAAFKDVANFPEEYVGKCIRFEKVWLGGNFYRVGGTKLLSPAVSSDDGKRVRPAAILNHRDLAFVMSEGIGRPLSLLFEDDSRYQVNLNCELSRQDKAVIARIYRIETINLAGNVKAVYEDK